jgi:hypothetical protein
MRNLIISKLSEGLNILIKMNELVNPKNLLKMSLLLMLLLSNLYNINFIYSLSIYDDENISWIIDDDIINLESIQLPDGLSPYGLEIKDDRLYVIGRENGYIVLYTQLNNIWTRTHEFGDRWEYLLNEGTSIYVTNKGYIIIGLFNATKDVLYVSKNRGRNFNILGVGNRNEFHPWKATEDDQGNIYLGLLGMGDVITHNPYVYKINPELTEITLFLSFPDFPDRAHIGDIEYRNNNLYIIVGSGLQVIYRYDLITNKLIECIDNGGDNYSHISRITGGFSQLESYQDGIIIGGSNSGFSLVKNENLTNEMSWTWSKPANKRVYVSDLVNIDEVVYFGQVGKTLGYSSGLSIYSTTNNVFMRIFNLTESENIYDGIKQISKEDSRTEHIYILYSIEKNSEKIRNIVRINKIDLENVSELLVGANKDILERVVYSYEPLYINLEDYDRDSVFIEFDHYSIVERIIRIEDFSNFNIRNYFYNSSLINADIVSDKNIISKNYLNLTVLTNETFSGASMIFNQRVENMNPITPKLNERSHVIHSVIFRTNKVQSKEKRVNSIIHDIYDENQLFERTSITNKATDVDEWKYEWMDLMALNSGNSSRFLFSLYQGETDVAYLGSYVTNQSGGFYPPVNGSYKPRYIVINGIKYPTDKPLLIKNISNLSIMLPPDGCGSIKIKIFVNDYTKEDIPYIEQNEVIDLYQGNLHKISIEGSEFDMLDNISLGEGVSLNKIESVKDDLIEVICEVDNYAELGYRNIFLYSKNGIGVLPKGLMINKNEKQYFVVNDFYIESSDDIDKSDDIYINITNIGSLIGENRVNVKESDELIYSELINMSPEEHKLINIKSYLLDEKNYEIKIEGNNINYNYDLYKNVTIKKLNIFPTYIRVSDEVEISLEAYNDGKIDSLYIIKIELDGDLIKKEVIKLGPLESKLLKLKINDLGIGSHDLHINNYSYIIEVNDEESRNTKSLFGIDLYIVFFLIIIVAYVSYSIYNWYEK